MRSTPSGCIQTHRRHLYGRFVENFCDQCGAFFAGQRIQSLKGQPCCALLACSRQANFAPGTPVDADGRNSSRALIVRQCVQHRVGSSVIRLPRRSKHSCGGRIVDKEVEIAALHICVQRQSSAHLGCHHALEFGWRQVRNHRVIQNSSGVYDAAQHRHRRAYFVHERVDFGRDTHVGETNRYACPKLFQLLYGPQNLV